MSHGNDAINAAEKVKLQHGFADPVFDAQAVFRTVLDALSYAGRVHRLETELEPPALLYPATAALALTLFDFDTPVWLDAAAEAGTAPDFLKFHCGSPLVTAEVEARFAVVADAAATSPISRFAIGEDRYPDRSATLLVQVPSFTDGPPVTWSGPGIAGTLEMAIAGLPADFWAQWADNHEFYPLGLDVIFISGSAFVGLPRGVKVED